MDAIPHLKKTNSIAGKWLSNFTNKLINENQNVDHNICLIPFEKGNFLVLTLQN
jgi:hypothetical protein